MNIVLLHGLAGSARYFASLEQELIGTGYATLSFDLLGFGMNVVKGEEYTLNEQLDWITSQIEVRFGNKEVILLGHSLGGILALSWAHAHPKQCAGVILLNTHMAISRDELLYDLHQHNTSWGRYMMDFPRVSRMACVLLCEYGGMNILRPWKPSYISEVSFQDYTKHSWKSVSCTFDRVYMGYPGLPLLVGLEGLPILNIYGLRDSFLDRPIDGDNIMNVGIETGHYAFDEQPEVVMDAIHEFLGETPSSLQCLCLCCHANTAPEERVLTNRV